MAPAEPPTEITLRVKVPPGHLSGTSSDEFTLGTLPTATKILEVRTRIQSLLPSQPAPERQRLLYAGRALVDNEQSLAEALNTRRDASQHEYVIHLLVKGEQGTGADGQGHRRAVSTPTGGTPRAGTPQAQGPPLPPGAVPVPQGLPPLPQGHVHANLTPQQVQHMALLQQRQAAQIQMRQAQMQQMQRQQFAPPFGGAGMPFGAPAMGMGMRVPGMMGGEGGQAAQVGNGVTGQQAQAPPQQGGGAGIPVTGDQQARAAEAGSSPAPGATENGSAQARNNADTPSQQPNTNSQAQQPQPQGPPHRPISGQGFHLQGVGPNGNRFEIHQQTLNIPGAPFPAAGLPQGQQIPFGIPQGQQLPFPGLPSVFPFGMPGIPPPQQAPQAGGVGSALDRARQNVAEMRQMVEEMRRENATEEERQRAQRLEERIQAVNDYIDPFGVGRTSRANTPAQGQRANGQPAPVPGLPGQPTAMPFPNTARPITLTSQHPTIPLMNPGSDTTCYLLSGRNGPQALLFSPEHGEFAGSLSGRPNLSYRFVQRSQLPTQTAQAPTPTVPTNNAQEQHQQQPPAPVAEHPAAAAAVPPAQAPAPPPAAQDPMQALMGHFWLLLRIMIFAYFVLGTNMGWQRPMALALIGAGFWMIRAGLFGDGGVLRRWWEGVVRVEEPRRGQQAEARENGLQANAGREPTPEQAAQRLLQQREEVLQRAPLHRLREQVRPVERAAALFLASLWPGVGEAHVRAREEAERRAMEEEVERRRAEEDKREREKEEREREREEGEKGEGAGLEAKGALRETGAGGNEQSEAAVEGEKSTPAAAETTVADGETRA